jgi:hypothetical protein
MKRGDGMREGNRTRVVELRFLVQVSYSNTKQKR